MKWILFWMYASRALAVGAYLLAPKTQATFYVFSVVLGLTWLATVPPTAGLVGKLFGTRFLATLFGLTLLSHQIGGFFGAWLGGLAIQRTGSYDWMWYADVVLAVGAALLHLVYCRIPVYSVRRVFHIPGRCTGNAHPAKTCCRLPHSGPSSSPGASGPIGCGSRRFFGPDS